MKEKEGTRQYKKRMAVFIYKKNHEDHRNTAIYFIIYITLPPPETIQVGKYLIWGAIQVGKLSSINGSSRKITIIMSTYGNHTPASRGLQVTIRPLPL